MQIEGIIKVLLKLEKIMYERMGLSNPPNPPKKENIKKENLHTPEESKKISRISTMETVGKKEKRIKKSTVSLSETEYKIIKEKANNNGMGISTYLRMCALNYNSNQNEKTIVQNEVTNNFKINKLADTIIQDTTEKSNAKWEEYKEEKLKNQGKPKPIHNNNRTILMNELKDILKNRKKISEFA